MTNIADSFSFGETAALSGVKPRTLDHWSAIGFLRPSVQDANGTGTRRRYSFSDVVAARAAKTLRTDGISLQGLRRAVAELRKTRFGAGLSDTCLVVRGKDVYMRDQRFLFSLLRAPGQTYLPFTVFELAPTIIELRARAGEIFAARVRTHGKAARHSTSSRSQQMDLPLKAAADFAEPTTLQNTSMVADERRSMPVPSRKRRKTA